MTSTVSYMYKKLNLYNVTRPYGHNVFLGRLCKLSRVVISAMLFKLLAGIQVYRYLFMVIAIIIILCT